MLFSDEKSIYYLPLSLRYKILITFFFYFVLKIIDIRQLIISWNEYAWIDVNIKFIWMICSNFINNKKSSQNSRMSLIKRQEKIFLDIFKSNSQRNYLSDFGSMSSKFAQNVIYLTDFFCDQSNSEVLRPQLLSLYFYQWWVY